MTQLIPLVDSYYEHYKKGTTYRVLHVANTEGDRWPLIVVYKDGNGAVWARPLEEWTDRYKFIPHMEGEEYF